VETLQDISEVLRLPSPAPKPMGLAHDGETLWMTSRETFRLYAIDPKKWTVKEEAQLPGKPTGITMLGDELRVILGFGDADDRYIYRYIPGHGLKNDRVACPDMTGSHLGYDGDTIFLSQAAYTRILALDGRGKVLREIPLPRKPLGMTISGGCFYLVTGDAESENLQFCNVDAHGEKPVVTTYAAIPFAARGLAFDGSRFWTSDRDNNQIVAFEGESR
jgi:hypothetical protein